MGEVFLAHDEVLGRDVAIKVLARHLAEQPDAVERFDREARSAASLSHPNIVPVHDRGATDDGTHYIAMEYVSGGTLKDMIDREGPLPPEKAVSITLQVSRALRAAHERGVIHRDIKPQNILLTQSGEVKVTDFGIARAASLTTLTGTGLIMGTAHYISPEQATGEPAGPRSDLYSLGIVLYEMLTGEVPYDAETPLGIAMKHVNGLLRSPRELNPRIPEDLEALILALLSKDPDGRPPDASSLIARLERLGGGAGASPASPARETTAPLAGTARNGRTGATRAYAPAPPPSPAPAPVPGPVPERRRGTLSGLARAVLLATGVLVLLLLAGAGAMALAGLRPVAGFLGDTGEPPPISEKPLPSEPRRSSGPPSTVSETTTAPDPTTTAAPPDVPADPEAEAEQAVGDYYRAAGLEDWDYTYDHLDSRTRSMFTREEWSRKNQWYWDSGHSIYHILSVDPDSSSEDLLTTVQVRVTGEDGSSFVRTTYWVMENGQWKHRFSPEDMDAFMPDRTFEEFVKANGGSLEESADDAPEVESVIRGHYEAIGSGDFHDAYSYFGPTYRGSNPEDKWVSDEESFDIRSATIYSVDVTDVTGDTATASVDVGFEDNSGSPRFSLGWDLVREDGGWKLDEVAGGGQTN